MTNYSEGIDIGNCSDSVNKELLWVGHHEYNNRTAALFARYDGAIQ